MRDRVCPRCNNPGCPANWSGDASCFNCGLDWNIYRRERELKRLREIEWLKKHGDVPLPSEAAVVRGEVVE